MKKRNPFALHAMKRVSTYFKDKRAKRSKNKRYSEDEEEAQDDNEDDSSVHYKNIKAGRDSNS